MLKKIFVCFVFVVTLLCIFSSPVPAQEVESDSKAMEISKILQKTQAQAFYKSKKFQDTIDIAEYILAQVTTGAISDFAINLGVGQ